MARPFTVVWTRPALDSLLEIVRRIQADNPTAARRFAEQIKTKVSRLERFPASARALAEFPASGLREVIAGDYRVICRIVEPRKTVEILTVRHGARLLDTEPGTD
jgi:plasmid stabilization system protein ParE